MRSFDVVVVGGGTAGAAAALLLRRLGRTVALVDKRPVGETGARWVNAVPRWCFEEAGLPAPEDAHLFRAHRAPSHGPPGRMHLVSPNGKGRVSVAGADVLHVDMRALTSGLLEAGASAGVELRRGTVSDAIVERGEARGVVVDGESLRANLVVDASGLGGVVRRRVLSETCPDSTPEHHCVAAQFQYVVKDPDALEAFLHQRGAVPGDDLGFPGIAGGYSTLTLFTRRERDVVGVLAGSIPALGVDDGGELVRRFVASMPWIGQRLWGGRGAIPLRRPYATLGNKRVALIGDAACQVYSSHGSGVGMGMLAARALADAVATTDDAGSTRALDRYARTFRRRHGGLLAASDSFRRYAQGLAPEALDALLGTGLLDAHLAEAAITQRPTRPDLRWVLGAGRRAMNAPGVALGFVPVAARGALLDRLGLLGGLPRIGGRADRALDGLIGAPAKAAVGAAWALPT
jgi:flavin-dependent dehydrogenase